jgi:hypothetical protein
MQLEVRYRRQGAAQDPIMLEAQGLQIRHPRISVETEKKNIFRNR